ncbi:MAG: hypothetical protein HXY50_16520 [Ignavibacteriaceae bacterium]|nr:hypothetical protein [Ignavibacteriaceae bacterium]
MQENKLIKALVLNAQLGNNSAFEQLYQMTVPQIYILTVRLSGGLTLAGTLTKKTYVNAWQKISQKDEKTTFLNWLKIIAASTVLEEMGRNTLEKISSENDPQTKENEEVFFNQQPLEKAIRALEFVDRFVLILHDLENLSFEIINKITSLSINDLRSKLMRSRENLMIIVEE